MGDYCCIRIWQLKIGASTTELEDLIRIEISTMQSLIPGVKRLSLYRIRTAQGEALQYMMVIAFVDAKTYMYWRQVEEEAPTYWPSFGMLLFRLEQTCTLLNEYVATMELEQIIG
jgi:hypothetical protein